MPIRPNSTANEQPLAKRAAAYVRMSTERQNYSIQHQKIAIGEYAHRHDITIVRTYADSGKSGLRVEGRAGLRSLLDDVGAGKADFGTILVYDVSRWGRFQDADESAYYEFICRRAGIAVIYCAEPFAEDDSPMAAVLKSLKRLMASEYSRELSAKVFAAQSNFTLMGFKQGGNAGYGLRRVALDVAGHQRAELRPGERKVAQTDRVVLGLGSPEEAMVVSAIYDWYLRLKLGEKRIAAMLNLAEIPGEAGRPWTKKTVNSVLTNEKYIGNAVYNRRSFKLKKRPVKNPPDMWIRRDGAYPALISGDVFAKAQTERIERHKRYSDEELLDILREIHAKHGRISALLISNRGPAPTPQTFKYHFGTLAHAYALAGLDVPEAFAYVESRRALRSMRASLVSEVAELARKAGGEVAIAEGLDRLLMNGRVLVKVMAVRSQHENSGLRWRMRMSLAAGADFVIAAQMDAANRLPLRYHLLPLAELAHAGKWLPLPTRLDARNSLAPHSYERLEDMFIPRR